MDHIKVPPLFFFLPVPGTCQRLSVPYEPPVATQLSLRFTGAKNTRDVVPSPRNEGR